MKRICSTPMRCGKTLARWQAIVDMQMGEIRDEFLGKKACEYTQKECQARVDSLYGPDIFKVEWYGGTEMDIFLIDGDKLLKRFSEIERSRQKLMEEKHEQRKK